MRDSVRFVDPPFGGLTFLRRSLHADRAPAGDRAPRRRIGRGGSSATALLVAFLAVATASPARAQFIGSDVTSDAQMTTAVALGDVDGDGDLDLVVGNVSQPDRLYLNNGTEDPWQGVTGIDISPDAQNTTSLALGDVDGDGDLDLVVGNGSQRNRLYLNNGTEDPWHGVVGRDISADEHVTLSVVLGDVDGDGDLDLVAGNCFEPNRLYLNNGTEDPFGGVAGIDITADLEDTRSVALGDVDGDGDLDLVVGSADQPTYLYSNNGTENPWSDGRRSEISFDALGTKSLVLADVDGDGDLDVVVGSYEHPSRVYLSDGSADPWRNVTGLDVIPDGFQTSSLGVGDIDGDGDVDLIAGKIDLGSSPSGQVNRFYLNNGTADPWRGTREGEITSDAQVTTSIALGDVDGDGNLDVVAGNFGQANRLYLNAGSVGQPSSARRRPVRIH